MEKLKLDDFTKYKFLSGLEISPKGSHTAFVLHEADLEDNKYLSNIYIYNNKDKDSYQLTSLGEEKSFVWKDSKNIIFPALRSEKDKKRKKDEEAFTSFYRISIDGGEAKKVFEIPLNVNSFKFIDDNNLILTALFDPDYRDVNKLSLEEKQE